MLAFVTVGSTRFDALVHAVLSREVLSALRQTGHTKVIVQCGNSSFDLASSVGHDQTLNVEREGVAVEIWKFKPSLHDEYEQAALIISHAGCTGSGTILDVLRRGKPLIVVPNPTLLDNHQEELASALAASGYLRSSTVGDLALSIENFNASAVVPFPPFDGTRFKRLLDEEMGFI